MLNKINKAGFVVSIFVIGAGAALYFTGNLHFGSAESANSGQDPHDDHNHGQAESACGEFCNEHNVPEAECTRCNPSLIAGFKAAGNWCAEHNLPESQCTICNPGLRAAEHSGQDYSEVTHLETAECEHGVKTIDCNECRYELGVVKVEDAVRDSLVQVTEVQEIEQAAVLTMTGRINLDPSRVVEVVSTGAGQVRKALKTLGDKVSEGDEMAVIYSPDLGMAKAQFIETGARLELAAATFSREEELHEKQITSEADFLAARNEFEAAKAYFAAAEKRLRLFGLTDEQIASVKDEKTNGHFAELTLRAPQAGTVVTQNISAGSLVDTTKSLYTIADMSKLWVWCDVYEKDLELIQKQLAEGKTIKSSLAVKAFPSSRFAGRIDMLDSRVDPHTRTARVRIRVDNESGRLMPGMFVEAEVTVPTGDRIKAVPTTAVLSDENKSFVFRHYKDNYWVRNDVLTGDTQGRFTQIVSGLPDRSKVICSGAFMLKSDILREKMGAGCAH